MSSTSTISPQVFEADYVDQSKLVSLLKKVYGTNDGKNNFRVELRLNRYKIYPCGIADATLVSEEQIHDCRASGSWN
ncbi:hypothetical protein MFRU_004g01910 [Monilinia fructicola]|nr:hypothetical protein MFRU_004g01910 [Monilinia fructicola]